MLVNLSLVCEILRPQIQRLSFFFLFNYLKKQIAAVIFHMIYIFCPSYLITPDCRYYFGFVGFFKPLKTAVYIKDTRTTSSSCFVSLFTHISILKVKKEHI